MKPPIKINHWRLLDFGKHTHTNYNGPKKKYLSGFIQKHSKIKISQQSGKKIRTSQIISAKDRVVETITKSKYMLGTVDPRYRKYIKDNHMKWDSDQPILMPPYNNGQIKACLQKIVITFKLNNNRNVHFGFDIISVDKNFYRFFIPSKDDFLTRSFAEGSKIKHIRIGTPDANDKGSGVVKRFYDIIDSPENGFSVVELIFFQII